MKKILTTLLAGAALLSSNVMAQGEQYYGELAYTWANIDGGGLSATPAVVAARFGVKFNENLSGEILLGTSASSDSVTVSGIPVDLKFKDVFGLYLKGSLPVTQQFNVFGRVGYLRAKIQASAGGYALSDSDNSFSYGAGAQYDFNSTVYGMVDYMSWYDRHGTKVSGPSLGVGLKF